MSGGTVSIPRSIWSDPAFRSAKFSDREAYIWMVSQASWKPRTVRVGDRVVDLKRGQFSASVRYMASVWGWSKSAVSRHIFATKNRDTIRTETGTGVLVITICNYDVIQGCQENNGTVAGQQPGQERDRSGTKQRHLKIKVKKEKKERRAIPPNFDVDFFAEFWEVYAHKTGKGQARPAFERARKKADPQTIIDAARVYASTRNPQYVKNASTWLNGECWDDDPEANQRGGQNVRTRGDERAAILAARRAARKSGGNGNSGDHGMAGRAGAVRGIACDEGGRGSGAPLFAGCVTGGGGAGAGGLDRGYWQLPGMDDCRSVPAVAEVEPEIEANARWNPRVVSG